MAQAEAAPDTRNLHWKQNNVGSTLLQKMGWKQGEAIGNKRRQKEDEGEVSSEGLKIVKRPDGLGLGAANKPNAESTGHDSFHQILQNLKQEHSVESNSRKSKSKKKKRKSVEDDDDEDSANSSSNKNKKQKKSKKSKKPRETIFATNKITNARVRESKFAAKNAQDMACIFGKDYSTAEIAAQMAETKRQQEEEKERQQQKDKKNRENTSIAASTSSSGEGETQEQKEERRRKRKEEKEVKRRKRREEKLKSLDEC